MNAPSICRHTPAVVAALSLLAIGLQVMRNQRPQTREGVEVIDRLDVSDLEPGKVHRSMFQGADMGTGQFYYVPSCVAKGVNPGERAMFVAGVHGDESSPVAAVQGIFAELDPATLSVQ